jgi:hypothetical protein
MGKGLKNRKYFLIDNGSLRAGSILQMRKIANHLSRSSECVIEPYGLMHSHKVDPAQLNGELGQSMQEYLVSDKSEQVNEIRALPFFLGPSLAITDWLPENLATWQKRGFGERKYRILPPLYQKGDNRLAEAMAELCLAQIKNHDLQNPRVAMVDHGTPLLEVNQVRELVGEEMQRILGGQVSGFSTCAMERRPDPQYDFNNPLLENLLEQWQQEGVSKVVVSQFFLLPGRHAGPNGDLAEICQPFIEKGMKIFRTDNLGAHPLVEQILLDRIQQDGD